MSKVTIMLFIVFAALVLVFLPNHVPVFASHSLYVTQNNGSAVSSIKLGEAVDLSTAICQKDETIKLTYVLAGSSTGKNISEIKASSAGVGVLRDYRFQQGGQYTLFAECNGHATQAALTITNPSSQITNPPTGLKVDTATITDSSVNISWDLLDKATFYQVYFTKKGERKFNKLGADPTTASTVVGGLEPDTEYLIHINGCNSNGCSAPSPEVEVKTLASSTPSLVSGPKPDTPTGLTADTTTTSGIWVSWNHNFANTTYFQIWYSKDKTSWTEFRPNPADSRRAGVTGLEENTLYYIHLNACNGTTCSDPTNGITARTDPSPATAGTCGFGVGFASNPAFAKSFAGPLALLPGVLHPAINNQCKTGFDPYLNFVPPSCKCVATTTAGAPAGTPGTGSGPSGPRSSAASGGSCGANRADTALGCVATDPAGLTQAIFKLVLSFAGGVALLLMVFGAIQMMASAGNPDVLKSGREQFTNAIIGLLFIVFAVLLLQIIGVDILNIPGFKQ